MDLMQIRRAMMMQMPEQRNLFDESKVTFGVWTGAGGAVSEGTFGCISETLPAKSGAYSVATFGGQFIWSMSLIEYDGNGRFKKRNHIQLMTRDNYSFSVTLGATTAYIALQVANGANNQVDFMTPEYLHDCKVMLVEGDEIPQKYIPY